MGLHLLLAETWTGSDPFLLLLGDSVYRLDKIPGLAEAKPSQAWIMPSDVNWDDMEKYAPAPSYPGYIQTGLWLFDHRLYGYVRESLEKPEIRIRDLVKLAVREQGQLNVTLLPERSFIDCGTPEAIRQLERFLGD